jgi:hypothetical protein
LLENFPYGVPYFIVNAVCALGLGSLISLLAFTGMGMAYRKKLGRRKDDCQTEFLRKCVLYDESAGRRKLEEEITHIERNARCVKRATWLMALLTALAVAGLYYPGFFLENLFDSAPRFIAILVCSLGVGFLTSLLAFAGLGMVYRRKLDQRRLECCHLVARLSQSRLG